ncbi:MAG: 30S ribosomal protein S6 [Pseudomonadota bacterium]|nr:30S ribosomal protein S6 [Pseudomonadota bacterium]
MQLYESVVIARQDISVTQAEALADDLSKILEEQGAKVLKRENWGLRSLAYRIKKNRKGHYLLFNIQGEPDAINDYERRMRIMEQVLRYLTIRVDEHEENESIIISSRGKTGLQSESTNTEAEMKQNTENGRENSNTNEINTSSNKGDSK